jgi:hypothetical protein
VEVLAPLRGSRADEVAAALALGGVDVLVTQK